MFDRVCSRLNEDSDRSNTLSTSSFDCDPHDTIITAGTECRKTRISLIVHSMVTVWSPDQPTGLAVWTGVARLNSSRTARFAKTPLAKKLGMLVSSLRSEVTGACQKKDSM
jgi:hypothetical protein